MYVTYLCICFGAFPLHVPALLAAVFALCTFLHCLRLFLHFARFFTSCRCFCALHVSTLLAAVFALCTFLLCLQLFLRFARLNTACSCVCALHVSALLAAVFALCKCTFLQGCHSFWRSAALPCTVRRNHAPSTVLYSMFNTLEVGKGIFFQGL